MTHKHDHMIEPQKQVAEHGEVERYQLGSVGLLAGGSKVEERRQEGREVNDNDTADPYQRRLGDPCPRRMADSEEYRLHDVLVLCRHWLPIGSYMFLHEIDCRRGQLLGAGEKGRSVV